MPRPSIARLSLAATLMIGLSSCHSETAPANSTRVVVQGKQANALAVYAKSSGKTSFVYVVDGSTLRRLTDANSAWEADPVLSMDGRLVAYSSGATQDGRADIWVAHVDGTHAHKVSTADQDALMPGFAADGRSVLYVIARSFGHSSPIAASRRHGFDVVKIAVDPDQMLAGSAPVELTQSYFYDVQSLSVSPDGEQFLVSTGGYPIGSLLQEFRLDHPLRQHRIFQPHVPGESDLGATFGQARYVGDGMEIVFMAASQPAGGGNYDYNVYRINEVTGGDLKQITNHKGMIDSLSVAPKGTVIFTDDAGYSQVSLPVDKPR